MKPARFVQLTEGKSIGALDNKGFTETFNWLVRFCRNLRGDGLYITVDNKFGDCPTVTFAPGVNLGGGSDYTPYPAPFDFTYKEITTTSTDPVTGEEIETTTNEPYITNCVWYMGREVRQLMDYSIDTTDSYTYWLKIETDSSGQYSTSSIIKNTYAVPLNGGAFSSPTNTDQYTHYPLWSIQVSDGTITPTFDWRMTWKTPFYST